MENTLHFLLLRLVLLLCWFYVRFQAAYNFLFDLKDEDNLVNRCIYCSSTQLNKLKQCIDKTFLFTLAAFIIEVLYFLSELLNMLLMDLIDVQEWDKDFFKWYHLLVHCSKSTLVFIYAISHPVNINQVVHLE